MIYPDAQALLSDRKTSLARGPIALILLEDPVEVASTLRHCLDLGFGTIIAFGSPDIDIPADIAAQITRVHHDVTADDSPAPLVNAVIDAAPPGQWLFYAYNSEYLFFPFCEHRSVAEMIAFHTEERRDALLTYVIDLYATDLAAHPGAVSRENAHLDRAGYYALARNDPQGGLRERQLDFYGGLRWRFEEHIPPDRRRIDRISLFKVRRGLQLLPDHTFNVPEYNTYACPWHNNITGAICSFRTAKALRRNPGSRAKIDNFEWFNSTPFSWQSRQLLELGLIEPGQWF